MKDEFAIIKLKGGAKYGRWKITARFTVVTKTGFITCVRLRPPNLGCSVYYSLDEFRQHFEIVK